MTKHSGSLLVEVLISITIFIIGLMALIGAITYSVGSIMKSREDISGDMEITNMTERDAMRLTIRRISTPPIYWVKIMELWPSLSPRRAATRTVIIKRSR